MAAESPLYDLLLLLSADAPEEQRGRVLSLVESAISGAGGTIERNDNWGRRPMAYQIRHRADSEYHLLQFRAPGSLIEELSHTLRITDGVLRFRIIKVRPGTPAVKSSPPPVVAAAAPAFSAPAGESAGAREDRPADTEEEPRSEEDSASEEDSGRQPAELQDAEVAAEDPAPLS